MSKPKQVRHKSTKPAQSAQRQSIGRLLRIDPCRLPAFLHQGNLVTAKQGCKVRLTVFRLTTSRFAPEYQEGDLLQLDPQAQPSHGNIVVAQHRISKTWTFGRLSIRDGAFHLCLPRLGVVDPALKPAEVRQLTYKPPSVFCHVYVVVGLIRDER